MWTIVTSFFGRYLTMIAAGGFLALATVTGVLWLQKASLDKQLDAEQLKTERLQAANDALNRQIEIKADAIAELESANKTLADQAADLNAALGEIANAPQTDDGAVSPLLDRALRRLRDGANPAR